MANYKVKIKASAAKELKKIPKQDLARITKKISNLSTDPRPIGSEKLSEQDRYRVRQGNYRIIYSVEDDLLVVFVVKIGHRKDICRNK